MITGKESCIADDVVQRCTDLITHIREEGLFQQLRLLCLLRLHSQLLLRRHHIGDVTIGAEVAIHLSFLIQHRHHVEEQPYLSALLVAYLYLDSLHDAALRQVIHPVQRTVHRSAEAQRGQADTAQLRHTHPLLRLPVDQFKRIGVGIIVHQLHTAHAQGVVDVGDILLDAFRALLQLSDAGLLAVVGVHHLRDVAARHIDTLQLTLLVADGVDGGFIIHLPLQAELLQPVFRQTKLAEVDDAARQRVCHLIQRYLTVEGVVLQEEAAVEHLLTALHVERLAGSLVNFGQHTVLVVVQHIEQRRVEDGVIASQQLVDLLLPLMLLCHVVLNSHQRGGQAVDAPAHHREGYLIISAV